MSYSEPLCYRAPHGHLGNGAEALFRSCKRVPAEEERSEPPFFARRNDEKLRIFVGPGRIPGLSAEQKMRLVCANKPSTVGFKAEGIASVFSTTEHQY